MGLSTDTTARRAHLVRFAVRVLVLVLLVVVAWMLVANAQQLV